MVLGRRPGHGRAADIDVLDQGLVGAARRQHRLDQLILPADEIERINRWTTVQLSDGSIVPLDVRYTGDEPIVGDLDFDGEVNLDDWALMKSGFSTDATSA